MKNLPKILAVLTTIATTGTATPSLDSKCNYTVATPPNGSNVLFDESCQIAYVMPPIKGIVEVGNLTRTTNLQFCPAVKSVGETAKKTFNSMSILSGRIEEMVQAIEPLNSYLIDMKIEVETAKSKMELANTKFKKAEQRIDEMRQKIYDARQKYEGCLKEHSIESPLCGEIKEAWDTAKNEIASFREGEYHNLEYAAENAKEEFEILSARYIEKKSQKGGFFSTTAAHAIIDEGNSSEWFSIKFNANSSDFNYDPQKQAEITRAVKEELFNKAFREFAILNAGAAVPPRAPQFLTTGAGRAASELSKCWHLYCQAGSAILGVANSIWGRSDAVAAFHRNNNVWVIEKVNGIEFAERSGSLSFKSK